MAYVEFLKANGIEDHSFVKEMDYQEVLNSQEIFGNELALFAKKELQKEVINLSIPGAKVYCVLQPLPESRKGTDKTTPLYLETSNTKPSINPFTNLFPFTLAWFGRTFGSWFWFLTYGS